jgi:hypothetical protein
MRAVAASAEADRGRRGSFAYSNRGGDRWRRHGLARRRRLRPSGGLLLLAPEEGAGPAADLGQDEGPERIQRGERRGIL